MTAATRQLHREARKQVIAVFREILSDPDAGLPLRADFVRGLRRSVQAAKQGRYKSLSEVLAARP